MLFKNEVEINHVELGYAFIIENTFLLLENLQMFHRDSNVLKMNKYLELK